MNTKPDDTTLALWLDDELEGEELTQVEAWAAQHSEQLAAREEIRQWRQLISASLPASEEPPAAEFFNERIQHAIREANHKTPAAASNVITWYRLWMPIAACAGMALAFWLGMTTHRNHEQSPGLANLPVPAELPYIYTPVHGVDAESFNSAEATIIVLSGVDAIPDTIDFSETASGGNAWRPSDSTAALEKPTTAEP